MPSAVFMWLKYAIGLRNAADFSVSAWCPSENDARPIRVPCQSQCPHYIRIVVHVECCIWRQIKKSGTSHQGMTNVMNLLLCLVEDKAKTAGRSKLTSSSHDQFQNSCHFQQSVLSFFDIFITDEKNRKGKKKTGWAESRETCFLQNLVPLVLAIQTSNPLSAKIIGRFCCGEFRSHVIPSWQTNPNNTIIMHLNVACFMP